MLLLITFLPYNSIPNINKQITDINIAIKPPSEKLDKFLRSLTITSGLTNKANNTLRLSFDKYDNNGTDDNKSVNAI